MIRIAIYSRKSRESDTGDSIGNQIAMCKEYCERNYIGEEIEYTVYEDYGFSGGNTNRPQFKELIKDIKSNKFDKLVCYKLDRISRNVADFSSTLELLQKNNCDFISIKEQFDTSTPMGKAMCYIASVFAQLERETIAERVKDNMLEMGKRGLWTGGKTPTGYDSESTMYLDEEGNERKVVKLVKNEEELKLVKMIYDVYLKEGSLHKTEVWFTKHNIKSKSGILLEKTSLKVILKNPVYVKSNESVLEYLRNDGWNVYGQADGIHGLLSYNKTKSFTINGKSSKKVKDKSEWIAAVSNVEGVIEPDTWLAVQKQFDNNRDTFPRLGKTHNAILAGKIRCGLCGGYMIIQHGRISKKTGKKLFYYVCSLKKRSQSTLCNCKNLKAEEIESSILYEIEQIAKKRDEYIKSLKDKINKNKKDNNINKRRFEIEKEISFKKKQIDRLVDKLALDDDLGEILIQKIKLLKNENQELIKQLEKIDNEIKDNSNDELNIDFISNLLSKCINISKLPKEEQSILINAIIDNIVYNSNDNTVEVNIINSKKK